METNCSSRTSAARNHSRCVDVMWDADVNSTLSTLEQYCVPFIAVSGVLGNLLAFAVFVRKPMRDNSSSFFLAARCLSDVGFLAVLLLIWVSTVFELYLSRVLVVCKALIFLSYVFGCLSVWLVVFVTGENYIRICKPFLVTTVCKTKHAKVMVILVLFVITGSYSFPFWTMTENCVPFPVHFEFVAIMVYLDSVLTLVVPGFTIAGLLAAMAVSTFRACQRRRRRSQSSMSKPANPTIKVTRMLFAVTLTFISLNLPSHIVRIQLMVSTIFKTNPVVSPAYSISQTVSLLLYYCSMSVNIFIYLLFGSRFRKTLKEIFYPKTLREHQFSQSQERLRNVSVYGFGEINYGETTEFLYQGSALRYATSSQL